MDWLILRDALNTACNITNATNKGVSGWVGVGMVGGFTILSDTSNQVVCTVDQTDGHSSSDHTTRRAYVKWNYLGPQATLLMHSSGPTGSVLVLCGLIGLAESHLQKQTFLSIAIVSFCLDSA